MGTKPPSTTTAGRQRRLGSHGRILLLVVLGFVALVVSTLGDSAIGRSSFSGVDLTQMHHPWLHERDPGFYYRDLPVNDTVDGAIPGHDYFVDNVRSGDIPQWNPYAGGGMPYASTPARGDWAPLSWVYLVVPLFYASAAAKVLEMGVAAGLTYLFGRSIRLSRAAAALSGVVYAGCGFQMAWTNWPQTQVAAFIPGVFWGIERLIQDRRITAAAPLTVCVASMLVGGFPGLFLYTGIAAGLYTVVRLASLRDDGLRGTASHLGRLGLALLLPFALTASLLLPFNEYLDSVDLTYREAVAGRTLDETTALTMVAQDAFGVPGEGGYFGPANIIETDAFIGVVPLLMVLIALAWRRPDRRQRSARTALLISAAVFASALYTGGPARAVLDRVPFVGSNFIGRGRAALLLMLVVIAGMGFDVVLGWATGRRDRPQVSTPRLVVLAGLAALGTGALSARHLALADDAGRVRDVVSALALPAVLTVLTVVALAVLWPTRERRVPTWATTLAAGAIVALALGQTAAASWNWHPRTSRDDFYPTTAAHEFLAAELGGDRIAVERDTMYPGTSIIYRLRSVTGHYLHASTWGDMLKAADPDTFVGHIATWSFLGGGEEVATAAVLDRMAARFFVTYPDRHPYGEVFPGAPQTGTSTTRLEEWTTVGSVKGPFRAVTVTTLTPIPGGDRPLYLEARVLDGDRQVAVGSRRLLGLPAGEVWVALPADTIPADHEVRVELRFTGGPGEAVEVELAASDSGLSHQVTRAAAGDSLELVFTEGVNIYRRLNALPRVRWASTALYSDDPLAAVAEALPPDTVVLSRAGAAGTPVGSDHAGSAGNDDTSVTVLSDTPDRLDVAVDATNDGWLVVADSLQVGWTATIDGETTELVDADHGLVALFVPVGEHRVRLEYTPRGRPVTTVVSALGVAVLIALFVLDRRRRSAGQGPDDAGSAEAVH